MRIVTKPRYIPPHTAIDSAIILGMVMRISVWQSSTAGACRRKNMRKCYGEIIKAGFRNCLIRTRDALGLSQEQMAPRLAMSVRAYCALEGGENGCGTVTLVVFLVFVCEDPTNFLEELRKAFEAQTSESAQLLALSR